MAAPPDALDAMCTGRRRFYAHKVVRDLLWAFSSPHMLAAAHFPVLPTRLFGADDDEVQHHPRVKAWLSALDADPSHLIAFLQGTTRSKGKMLALGVYFASLLEYWLRFCPLFRVERFALGKQIVSASGQTVGQLKFLLRLARRSDEDDSASARATQFQDLHVESSVKFFLLHPLEDADAAASEHPVQLEQFVGPHLGENLAWRVQEVARKLAMCKGESVQRWLEAHYSDSVTSHMVLRGYLFYPLGHYARTADVTQRHDWAFHTNPATSASKPLESVIGSPDQSHPSIALDHLRGWWTSDLAGELPAKVHANAAAGIGPSRFVVLPKLHWLSPVIAREATDSEGGAVIVDGDASLGIETLELLTLDALVAAAQEHFAAVASTPVASSAVIMPLLIAELVRCRPGDAEYEAASGAPQRWKELSRGFVLDPASWDPRPLCHDAVRFRRVGTTHDADAPTAREYEGRREWVHDSVIVKPSDDELAKSLARKQHAFAEPHTVTPRALCDEMLTVVGAKHKPAFTHANLKASIQTVLEAHCEESSAIERLDAAAFVLQCLECLVLPVSSGALPPEDVKAAQRVGHLILDAFEAQAFSALSGWSGRIDKRGWRALFLRVVQDVEAWSFVFLALRAADVACRCSGSHWSNDSSSAADSAAVEAVVRDLLGYRTPRANAIAVETIGVFWLRGSRSSQDAEPTMALVRRVFDTLVDQVDWTSAEQLAVQSHDVALQQHLAQCFVRLNMSKALKRLHRAMAAQHAAQHPHDHAALRSLLRHRDSSVHVTYTGPRIDHEANRSLRTAHGLTELRWELVDSPAQLDAVLARLVAQEQDIAACATRECDPLDAVRRVVIGMDCEWRPQFLRSSAATDNDGDDSSNDDNGNAHASSSISEGLSVYQLAISDCVFVVDVQALGEAAATPLQFIWTRPNTFALVGFCVTSDVKRLAVSFPGLFAAAGDDDDEQEDGDGHSGASDKLLVELKQLALYRHVPASKWGLAQLARVCLDDSVDKEQQCSDWSARPLTQRQLVYAAKDAFAVQQIALHLLADVPLRAPADVLACLRQFAVVTGASAPSFGHWVAPVAPLSLDDVRIALTELELTDATSFRTIARTDGTWDGRVETPHGVVVKTIAVAVHTTSSSSSSGASSRAHTVLSRYAAVVVALDRSIDMAALGRVLGVAADDVVLADRETLIRIFGYSRGCVGPLGLREQQDIQVVVDERLLAADRLLCGAGAIDHVYAIAPAVLVDAAQAVVAWISQS